jgi:hypothetical protein
MCDCTDYTPAPRFGQHQVAWLSLDEGGNDLTRHLTYLTAALQATAKASVLDDYCLIDDVCPASASVHDALPLLLPGSHHDPRLTTNYESAGASETRSRLELGEGNFRNSCSRSRVRIWA